MNKFCLIAWLLIAAVGKLHAQTNVFAPPLLAQSQTVITSTVVFFSNADRKLIYSGGVRVVDSQLILTCEQLTADLPTAGGHIDRLIALTNVVMDSVDQNGQTNHATGAMAVYDYSVKNGVTNELVTLSGNARAENSQIILFGEPIIYNRATGSLTATNQHMIIKQNLSSALVSTNPPAAGTNFPRGTNRIPVLNTNRPPPP